MSYAIIGYACDLAGVHLGAARGPRVLRERGLLKCFSALHKQAIDLGDVQASDSTSSPVLSTGESSMTNALQVYRACESLYSKTAQALEGQLIPIVIGGDHSGAIGSFAAISDHYRLKEQKVGLIYIDAHPDANTWQTSESRRIYGTTVAVLSGNAPGALASLQKSPPALDTSNLAYLGIRDVDYGERQFINQTQITALSIKEIDRNGMANCVQRAIEAACKDTAGFFVSFDIDACDPQIVPGTQLPIRGGLSFRESHLALEMLYDSNKLLGFELSEFNPDLDIDFKTSDFCLSLIESAIGKSIL